MFEVTFSRYAHCLLLKRGGWKRPRSAHFTDELLPLGIVAHSLQDEIALHEYRLLFC